MTHFHIPSRRQSRSFKPADYEHPVDIKSLKAAFKPALEPLKIFVPVFKVGERVLVDDQKVVIEGEVYSISVPNRYEVIDDQGFIHVTEAIEYPDAQGAVLRCIVTPTNKVSAGYHPKAVARSIQ